MSFWDSFVIPLGLGVLSLLALFHLGIVLLGLLEELATWRLPVSDNVVGLITADVVLVLCGRLLLKMLVKGFAGLAFLVLDGKEFD